MSGQSNHYESINLEEKILEVLKYAFPGQLFYSREQLSSFDEFHLQGAEVTQSLTKKLQPGNNDQLLDVGCGIGGASRMLADIYGCTVTGIDLTRSYIRTAKKLSTQVKLSSSTDFLVGDATNLPFADAAFDIVWTQHAQMNIADKNKLYHEIERVIKPGGKFLYHDIFSGNDDPIHLPVPWAESKQQSHLIAHRDINGYFPNSGWHKTYEEEFTTSSIHALEKMFRQIENGVKPPLGLHLLMGNSTAEKMHNLLQNLKENRVAVFAGIFEKEVGI